MVVVVEGGGAGGVAKLEGRKEGGLSSVGMPHDFVSQGRWFESQVGSHLFSRHCCFALAAVTTTFEASIHRKYQEPEYKSGSDHSNSCVKFGRWEECSQVVDLKKNK